jgi:hypothetical protein
MSTIAAAPKTISVEFKGTLPGEAVIVALLNYYTTVRETMSQENRDEWDKRILKIYDDWRQFWVDIGVLKP